MVELLKINKLNLFYNNFHALKDIVLSIKQGEILGLVGESGSGKSSLANSILKLLPFPLAKLSGEILYEKNNILELKESDLYKLRGNDISIIFQAHSSALNPVLKVNKQVAETIFIHSNVTKQESLKKAEILLQDLEVPIKQLSFYPHQLSGGMKQRVMIASAIANKAKLLIADEPTTALDPTIEQSVVKLLLKINKKYNMTILFVSHDINLLTTISDRTAVMYGGIVVELANSDDIYKNPMHPYSKFLLNSKVNKDLSFNETAKSSNKGCPFANKCSIAQNICFVKMPQDKKLEGRVVKCHLI